MKNKKNKRPQKGIPGRKPANVKTEIDKQLTELYFRGGIDPWHASINVKCSYEYAVAKFKDLGEKQVEKEEEDWFEKNKRVRLRALSGISNDIKDSEKRITRLTSQLGTAREIYNGMMGHVIEDVENSSSYEHLQDVVSELKQSHILELYNILDRGLNMQKNWGYYINTLEQTLNKEHIFKSELQQQYDSIEIIPPPEQVLEILIEKRIAEKNNILKKNQEIIDTGSKK